MRIVPICGAILGGLVAQASAAGPENPNTDWFKAARYGVFVHYLEDLQNAPDKVHSLGRQTSWDQCVREFDVERFAEAMKEAGAGYVIFTTHQRTQYLIAPNAAFDRLTGYRPGEACATRDLVEDLWKALHARGIPLMLYWTGNGPSQDPKGAAGLGWTGKATPEYVARWAQVAREYGERYGEKVAGWWVDGCYPFIGYDEAMLGTLAEALRAGNPRRIVALNPGVLDGVRAYSRHDDFTAGEQDVFRDRPASRWLDGAQWHILSYLGCSPGHIGGAWGSAGVAYSREQLTEYVFEVNDRGGVVSIDVLLFRDGGLDRSQLEVLKGLRPGLAAATAPAPVPPGNLAFHKPARLLSLDGQRELPVNSFKHFPRLGVDGRPQTMAMAAAEWPWTYEVDLLTPHALRKLTLVFGPGAYATSFEVQGSLDRKEWTRLANVPKNRELTHCFELTGKSVRYIRIRALKPDGPEQPGNQMAIAELAAFE